MGVDLDPPFVAAARARARELRVSHAVEFVEGDASGHVSPEPVDLASCCGATWIGGGVTGTVRLLERSLRPGGIMLIGEPYWRRVPEDDAAVAGGAASSREDFLPLWDLVGVFREAGYDPVEMVPSDQDDWDRYVAAHWPSMRRWLDAHPDDELAARVRHELDTGPERYLRYQREYPGWGVFALMRR
ncbi:methyltransferase domain-containing protein [Nocardiopsis protaetiae]|uniref:methyltransferase domain-containing protein n=1 Tax=Nocardiopsis protaetiae TaxID=3382270 RepID=UPI00387B41F6